MIEKSRYQGGCHSCIQVSHYLLNGLRIELPNDVVRRCRVENRALWHSDGVRELLLLRNEML